MVGRTKRKSEGDLPNHRGKAVKNGSFKNDLNDSDHDEDSSGVTDQHDRKNLKREKKKEKEKKKARMSEPARVSVRELEDEDDDEYIEDSGRDESKVFLELDNLEKKKKKSAEKAKAQFMERFIGIVDRDAEGVKNLTADKDKEISGEQKKFLDSLHASYALSAPFKKGEEHEIDIHDFALNYRRGQDMITRAFDVISQFDKLAEKNIAKEFDGILGNDWGKEDEQIAKMLELGKMVGLNRFECVMNASKPDVLDVDAIEVSKEFFPVNGEGGCIGWGKEAKKHERANKKLLKAFENKA